MKAVISHGDNRKCPSVTVDGASHCPGHEVNVPEYTEEQFAEALAHAYGRGYRRAFEDIKKNSALWVLTGAGLWDEAAEVLKNRLKAGMGPEAVKGWDSLEF